MPHDDDTVEVGGRPIAVVMDRDLSGRWVEDVHRCSYLTQQPGRGGWALAFEENIRLLIAGWG